MREIEIHFDSGEIEKHKTEYNPEFVGKGKYLRVNDLEKKVLLYISTADIARVIIKGYEFKD